MNKYALMLVAAGLIAAAPAYYAFQAQAEEKEPAGQVAVTAPSTAATPTHAAQPSDAAATQADQTAPAAGDKAGEAAGTNE